MDFGNLKRCVQVGDGYKAASGITVSDITVGQQIGNWQTFERRSLAKKRKPSYAVFVELHGEIDPDKIESVSYTNQSEDSLAEPRYGTGNITIVDEDGDYIENGRTTFRKNQKVYVDAGFNDDMIPRFAGIIREVALESNSKTISLDIANSGYVLEQNKTSGDHSAYTTPKALVDYLVSQTGIGAIDYENESGPPSTLTFGTTYFSLRNFWKLVHGSALLMGYKQYFSEKGRLQLTRRSTFEETAYTFDDSIIEYIKHDRQATLINKKIVDFFNCIRPEFTAGDGIVAGQHTRNRTDSLSKHKHGEFANAETDELIGNWANAGMVIDQSLDWYAYPRDLYKLKCQAIPQLQIDDRIFVNSKSENIKGYFTIEKTYEYITSNVYTGVFTILSAGERY